MTDCFRFNEPIRTPNHPDKAYVVVVKDGEEINIIRFGEQYEEREWVGLTDDEIEDLWGDIWGTNTLYIIAFGKELEAKLKEKNA